jgi:hypothetical protein
VTIANCVSGYVVNPMEQGASWECNFLSEHNVLDYVKQGDDGAQEQVVIEQAVIQPYSVC